jgi:hypothetical protein
MWDKILTLFRAESVSIRPNSAADTEQDGFHRFMEEYARQQGTTLAVVLVGSDEKTTRCSTAQGRQGNGGSELALTEPVARTTHSCSAAT